MNEDIVKRIEEIAKLFHETYERLAPNFGYATMTDSRKPWSEVPKQNKSLMIAVVGELVPKIEAKAYTELSKVQSQLAEEMEYKSEHMLKITGLRQTCSDKSKSIIDLQSQLNKVRIGLEIMKRGQGKGQITGIMKEHHYRGLAKELLFYLNSEKE